MGIGSEGKSGSENMLIGEGNNPNFSYDTETVNPLKTDTAFMNAGGKGGGKVGGSWGQKDEGNEAGGSWGQKDEGNEAGGSWGSEDEEKLTKDEIEELKQNIQDTYNDFEKMNEKERGKFLFTEDGNFFLKAISDLKEQINPWDYTKFENGLKGEIKNSDESSFWNKTNQDNVVSESNEVIDDGYNPNTIDAKFTREWEKIAEKTDVYESQAKKFNDEYEELSESLRNTSNKNEIDVVKRKMEVAKGIEEWYTELAERTRDKSNIIKSDGPKIIYETKEIMNQLLEENAKTAAAPV